MCTLHYTHTHIDWLCATTSAHCHFRLRRAYRVGPCNRAADENNELDDPHLFTFARDCMQ